MEKFQMKMIRDHVILEMNGRKILLDSGSPVSFGGGEVRIGGKRHELNFPVPFSIASMRQNSKVEFDAVMGSNVLAEHSLILDPVKGEATFDASFEGGYPLDVRFGYPLVDAVLNGTPSKFIFDTGANIMFFPADWHATAPVSTRDDFNFTGPFTTGVWEHEVEAFGKTMKLQAGESPQREAAQYALGFRTVGVTGVLGIEVMKHGRVAIDFPRRRVALLPYGDEA